MHSGGTRRRRLVLLLKETHHEYGPPLLRQDFRTESFENLSGGNALFESVLDLPLVTFVSTADSFGFGISTARVIDRLVSSDDAEPRRERSPSERGAQRGLVQQPKEHFMDHRVAVCRAGQNTPHHSIHGFEVVVVATLETRPIAGMKGLEPRGIRRFQGNWRCFGRRGHGDDGHLQRSERSAAPLMTKDSARKLSRVQTPAT